MEFIKQEPLSEATHLGIEYGSVNTLTLTPLSSAADLMPTETAVENEIIPIKPLNQKSSVARDNGIKVELPEVAESKFAINKPFQPYIYSIKNEPCDDEEPHAGDSDFEFIPNEPSGDEEPNVGDSDVEFVPNKPRDDDGPYVECNTDNKITSTDTEYNKVLLVETENSQVSFDKPTHICHLCNKSFKQRRYLYNHLQRHKPRHVDPQLPTHNCHICNKSFKERRYLYNHLQRHKKRDEAIAMHRRNKKCAENQPSVECSIVDIVANEPCDDRIHHYESAKASSVSPASCDADLMPITKTASKDEIIANELLNQESLAVRDYGIKLEIPEVAGSCIANKPTESYIDCLKNEPCYDDAPSNGDSYGGFVKNEPCADNDEPSVEYADDETINSVDCVEKKLLIVETEEAKVSLDNSAKVIPLRATHNCHLCDKSFTQRRYLCDHLKRHKKRDEAKEMNLCNKSFKRHKPKHVDPLLPTYNCHLCNNSFTQRRYLCDHLKRHKKRDEAKEIHWENEECPDNESCVDNDSYPGISDDKTMHSTDTAENNKIVETHKCNICYKSFSNKGYLKRHLNWHKTSNFVPMKPSDYEKLNKKNATEQLCECNKCDTSFDTVSGQRNHDGQPYKCPYCPMKFACNNVMLKHKITHDQNKPYACDFCDNTYEYPSMLRAHLKIVHTTERPYKCNECGKTFKEKSTLKYHFIRRTDGKPHECARCQLKFYCSGEYQKHKILHEYNQYACKICGLKFSKFYKLKNHRKLHKDVEKTKKCEMR